MAYIEYETKRDWVRIKPKEYVGWHSEFEKWFDNVYNKYKNCKILHIIQHSNYDVTIIFEYKVEVKNNNKSNRP